MHPWMAHLHPGFRTTLLAWLITRASVLAMLFSRGELTPTAPDPVGAPAWGVLAQATAMLGERGPWVLLGLGELVMLAAVLAMYHFCRKDALPQTAERAAWLLALSPLVAMLSPTSAWTFAVGASLCALGAAVHARYALATCCVTLAICFRPETALLAPGLALLGWRARQPGKTPEWAPFMLGLAPIAALSLVVFASLGLAGVGGISMRSLHPEAWREGVAFRGLSDVVVGLGIVAFLGSAARFYGRTPRAWIVLGLPCLIWPLLHQEPASVAPIVLCVAPIFAYLAKIGEDPSMERILVVTSAMTLMLCV